MTNADRSSQDSKNTLPHTLRDAFDRATRWLGNLLAPLVIITYAKEAKQGLDYIMEHPLLTAIFALIFFAILAYNVVGTLKLQFGKWMFWRRDRDERVEAKADQLERQAPAATIPAKGQRTRDAMLRWAAIAASSVALLTMAYAYVAVFVTGLYFVDVAAAPNKESALREIHSLNEFLENHGYPDPEVRAYPTTSPWYMITIGGWHTSEEAAERTFQRAKKALGPRMRSDARIFSTQNLSPLRVLVGYGRKGIHWIKSAFTG